MDRLRLYELTNVDGDLTSPFVWRVKLSLHAKRLDYVGVPISFFGIMELARKLGADLKTVPIIERNGWFLSESWRIVE
jgi:hypothetical protein